MTVMSSSTSFEDATTNAQSYWATTTRLRLDAIQNSVQDRRRRQQMLKLELQALQDVLSSANKLYNTQASICSLPPETLCQIFAYLKVIRKPIRTMYYQERKEPSSIAPGPVQIFNVNDPPSQMEICRAGWMSLTHVCSYWREIIIGNPSLWATHANCLEISPLWLPNIMFRSQTLPLDLTFDSRSKKSKDRFQYADRPMLGWLTRSMGPRIKRLAFVDCLSDFVTGAYYEKSDLPLDRLEDLHIDVSGVSTDDREYANDRLTQVLRDWKGALAPRLRNLTLLCNSVLWDSPMFSAELTSLRIELPANTPAENIPKYREIAKLLRSFTSLERLTLVTAIPLSVPNPPRITLAPTLRNIKLGADGRNKDCLKFLQQLVIPEGCCISIKADKGREDNGPVRRIFSHLWNLSLPRELVIDESGYAMHRAPQAREFWVPQRNSKGQADATAILDVGSMWYGTWHATDSIEAPDLSPLQALSFHYMGYEGTAWPAHYASAVNVKRLGIRFDQGDLGDTMLNALTELSPVDNSTFKLCPALDTLVLIVSAGYFSRALSMHGFTTNTVALVNLVLRRKEGGAPIKELVVHASMRNWTVWESLREDVVVTFAS